MGGPQPRLLRRALGLTRGHCAGGAPKFRRMCAPKSASPQLPTSMISSSPSWTSPPRRRRPKREATPPSLRPHQRPRRRPKGSHRWCSRRLCGGIQHPCPSCDAASCCALSASMHGLTAVPAAPVCSATASEFCRSSPRFLWPTSERCRRRRLAPLRAAATPTQTGRATRRERRRWMRPRQCPLLGAPRGCVRARLAGARPHHRSSHAHTSSRATQGEGPTAAAEATPAEATAPAPMSASDFASLCKDEGFRAFLRRAGSIADRAAREVASGRAVVDYEAGGEAIASSVGLSPLHVLQPPRGTDELVVSSVAWSPWHPDLMAVSLAPAVGGAAGAVGGQGGMEGFVVLWTLAAPEVRLPTCGGQHLCPSSLSRAAPVRARSLTRALPPSSRCPLPAARRPAAGVRVPVRGARTVRGLPPLRPACGARRHGYRRDRAVADGGGAAPFSAHSTAPGEPCNADLQVGGRGGGRGTALARPWCPLRLACTHTPQHDRDWHLDRALPAVCVHRRARVHVEHRAAGHVLRGRHL